MMRVFEKRQELHLTYEDAHDGGIPYSASHLAMLKKAWKSYRPAWTHFKFIERICEWKIVEGYCYKLAPTKCIRDATRICDETPPLRSRNDEADSDKKAIKRVRAGVFKVIDQLPASRLTGVHHLRLHPPGGGKQHRCDWPLCVEEQRKDRTVCEDGINTAGLKHDSSRQHASTQLYCDDCETSDGKRKINLHIGCWGYWHRLDDCPQCPGASGTPFSPTRRAAPAAASPTRRSPRTNAGA
jgi:hypothetical protein